MLLNVSPASVERPRTPSDLAFSILNRTQTFSAIPDDYAAEFAPYWLVGHQNLEWRDDIGRNFAASISRTLALSLATADVGSEDAPATGLAIGGNVFLLSGRLSAESQERLQRIETFLMERARRENELFAARSASLEAEYGARIKRAVDEGNTELVQRLTQELTAAVNAARAKAQNDPVFREWLEQTKDQIEDAEPKRTGMFLGVAGGLAWGFPEDVWERGRVSRMGVWTTLSYEGQPLGGDITFTPVAVVRYLEERGDSASRTIDAGGRFILSGPAYAASLEGVVRMPREEGAENLYRIAGIFEYRLASGTWFTATLGRDHNSNQKGSLLAQFGVKLHLSDERYAAPAIPLPGQ